MAAALPSEPLADPVLPHASRVGLVLWLVVQWVAIPVEFFFRAIWFVVMVLGGESPDDSLISAPAKFMSPRKFLIRMSHAPARKEEYLNRELTRLSREIEQQKFSWRTQIHHHVSEVKTPGLSLGGVGLNSRDYRGTPLSTLTHLAHKHNLTLVAGTDLRDGVLLRSVERKV
ncbi:hypothetical protein [Streptomyces altiplanensis]